MGMELGRGSLDRPDEDPYRRRAHDFAPFTGEELYSELPDKETYDGDDEVEVELDDLSDEGMDDDPVHRPPLDAPGEVRAAEGDGPFADPRSNSSPVSAPPAQSGSVQTRRNRGNQLTSSEHSLDRGGHIVAEQPSLGPHNLSPIGRHTQSNQMEPAALNGPTGKTPPPPPPSQGITGGRSIN